MDNVLFIAKKTTTVMTIHFRFREIKFSPWDGHASLQELQKSRYQWSVAIYFFLFFLKHTFGPFLCLFLFKTAKSDRKVVGVVVELGNVCELNLNQGPFGPEDPNVVWMLHPCATAPPRC